MRPKRCGEVGRVGHADLDPGGQPLPPPGEQRRQERDGHRAVRALNADVRHREIGTAKADRPVGGGRIAKQHECRFFRLEKPLVGGDANGIGGLQTGQHIAVPRRKAERTRPGRIDMGPGGVPGGGQGIDGTGPGGPGGQHQAGLRQVTELADLQPIARVDRAGLEREAQDMRRLGDGKMRRGRGDHAAYADDVTRRPERRQVGDRGTGRHVPAVHGEDRRQPIHHPHLDVARHRRNRRVQQVLVQPCIPQPGRPGDPGRRRIHMGEGACVVEPGGTIQYQWCQPVDHRCLAEALFRQLRRQRVRRGAGGVGRQGVERPTEAVRVDRETRIQSHASPKAPAGGRRCRRGWRCVPRRSAPALPKSARSPDRSRDRDNRCRP